MAGKYGIPYFANFINSDMNPEDARSMCCRLRLDKRELKKRGGGLFGAAEKTGSIGVVTINLPRIAFMSQNEYEFWVRLNNALLLAKESLEIKREFLQEQINRGLLPAFSEYVGTLKNHFSTIGLVGMNEMCLNWEMGDISTREGKGFALKVLDYMRERVADFQEETGNLYNLEATPAESTCYRLALKDKEMYPDIKTQQGANGVPYYTNSCHLPVHKVKNLTQLFSHQDELQQKFTGGTVVHMYAENQISGDKVKHIVKTCFENYGIPYVSYSPVIRTCPVHGHVNTTKDTCPYCDKPLTLSQRITGYVREIKNFNDGKYVEFKARRQL